MKRIITRVARIHIVFAMILALAFCAPAQAETYEAKTMRLLHYQGSVEIFNPSGESRFVMENVRFSSGEVMQTGADGLASVGLDETKIVTLDADSRVEFIQEADHFRLNLLQGAIILDVQEKLDENESLDIQTSTMTVGIRGTLIFVSEEVADNEQKVKTRLGVMEGTAQIDYEDQSGAHRLMPVPAGQLVTIECQTEDKSGVSPVITNMTSQDVEGFVTDQVLSDAALTQRVIEGSGMGEEILLSTNPLGSGEENTFDYPLEGDWIWNGTVTLVAQSASKMYDGQPLTRPSDVLVYGLPQGVNIQVSAAGSQTNAGEGINYIANYKIYNEKGEDVTEHFTHVEKVSGKLTVDPAPLIVWTGSAEKYYDGEPLTNPEVDLRTVPGYEIDEPTWRNTSFVTRTALGSETMIAVTGSTWVHSTNPITGETREIVLFTGQRLSVRLNNEEDNGSIEFQIETLKVSELPEEILRLYADNPDLMAQACEDAGWDPELLAKRIAELPEQTEEKVLKNGLNVVKSAREDLMRDSTDVRITIDTEITNYRSQPLTGNEAHFTPIAIDPTIVITATGSQTEVGESPNTYKIDWGSARPGNYILSEDLGTLTVLPLIEDTVTITANSARKTYDGQALEADAFTAIGFPEEYIVRAMVQGHQTNAGSSENRIVSYEILDENGEDASGQFVDIQIVSGRLEVTPAKLTVTTGGASKAYDGTALSSEEATLVGLQGGESATVTATGTQTDVGTSENGYTI
ncbi:MAG: FecR domain-containing protein, partial [Clostridia bacterium]|nr:FecR domain-containing protein [Clostridia bacterium]